MDDRIEWSRELYERAVFAGNSGLLVTAERDLDGVEADLALARGRILHARFLAEGAEDPRELPLFERAAEVYRQLGDVRGEAESLFWVGTVHQVIRQDRDRALPAFVRARELAVRADDRLTLSYVLRHLAFAEQAASRMDAARELMEESTRLRRDLEFLPGVAANLVALAGLAISAGRRDDAKVLLNEATVIAESSGAYGVLGWVDQARADL
ncbi:MAG: tetratricopeptide repeat protein [Micromonospora sp.]